MLKRFYIMALVLASASMVYASPVDKQSALNAAKEFLADRGSTMQLVENKQFRAAKRNASQNEEAYYYIFNATDNGGFVIVAGDDKVQPILGYGDKGNIDPDNMPDGLKAILHDYRDAIDQLAEMEEQGTLETSTPNRIKRSMSLVKYPVKPFLNKLWGHKDPFNALNPVINDSVCPSGCANVSIAEIMGYYEYPANHSAIAGYTTVTRGIKVDALPDINFDYQNMLSDYSIETFDEVQAGAVATLMRYIGQALKSDYTPTTTPSTSNRIVPLFKSFGYNTSKFTEMKTKTDNEWEDIFYQNLINKQPILICASNVVSNGSGHTYIIDGCDQDGYYHIDWGWTGNANGYFLLTNLSPYQNTLTYTYMRNLHVIYDIVPTSLAGNVTSFTTDKDASLTTTAIQVASEEEISITRKNMTGAKQTFKQGIGLVGTSNNIIKVLDWDSLTYTADQSVTSTWNVLDLSGVREGTYRIYPISQISDDDDTWHFDLCNSTDAFVEIVISDSNYVMTAQKAIVYNSFTTDSTLAIIHGAARKYKLNITNNTLDKFQKRLYLYEDSVPADFQVARIPMNSTGDVEFTYCPSSSGKHVLILCNDTLKKGTSEVILRQEVDVEKAVNYKLEIDKYEVANFVKSGPYLYGNSLRIKFTIKNIGETDYDDFVRFLLKHGSWFNTKKVLAHIPVGETRVFEFECNNLAYGISYPMSVSYKPSSTSDSNILPTTIWNVTFKPRPGICTWKADGKLYASKPSEAAYTVPEDVLALDLSGLPTVPETITPNSNPNTLYSVTQNYNSLEGYNQIVEGVAKHIKLTDGYSSLFPFDFHTDTITYTRTFEKGFTGRKNGNNWSTIALPFTVEKVFNVTDSVEVDWFKPGDNDQKNFWVRKFYGEDGGYAYFEDTEAIKAYVPYIITVPSDYKGEEYSLVGKPLEFSATDADITTGKVVADTDNYNFQGSFTESATYGNYIYLLDEENGGNNFAYTKGESTTMPFRAYFTSETKPLEGSRLLISSHISFNEADGIKEMATTIQKKGAVLSGVYHISGQKLGNADNATVKEILQSLPAGIYIINGKKYKK